MQQVVLLLISIDIIASQRAAQNIQRLQAQQQLQALAISLQEQLLISMQLRLLMLRAKLLQSISQ